MQLDSSKLNAIKTKNKLQSFFLFVLMAVFTSVLAYWLFGFFLAFFAIIIIAILGLFNPAFSPRLIMKAYGANKITPIQAPDLYQLNQLISQRAELEQIPDLYYLPIGTMNAFASGTNEAAVIGLSDGLLRHLSLEEIAGVLAHEISHIKHNDIHVMSMADTLGMLTQTLSMLAQIILIVFIPAILTGLASINFLPFMIIIFAPLASALIQLALSRKREYLADLSAAQLLGSPQPLIKALLKLDSQGSYWERFYYASTDRTLLRTHPTTKDRVQQLKSLFKYSRWEEILYSDQAYRDLLSYEKIMPNRIGRFYWF